MGKVYNQIEGRLHDFLLAQPVFFVATAPSGAGGHINLSPKGLTGAFAVFEPRRVGFLDYTGSGAETIAHLRDNGRIVLMFCAFEGPPNIVRLHGRGQAVLPEHRDFEPLRRRFGPHEQHGLRSIITVEVERISDSCGFAVPLMAYQGDRTLLAQWGERRSEDDLAAYWRDRNATSIDGLPALS